MTVDFPNPKIRLEWCRVEMPFAFPATTSRGTLTTKSSWFIKVEIEDKVAIAEASPLPGLSFENATEVEDALAQIVFIKNVTQLEAYGQTCQISSIRFAIDCLLLELWNEPWIIFPSTFTNGTRPIEINGLVWMDSIENMRRAGEQKWAEGFTTLKFKIGHFDWESELELLTYFRMKYGKKLTVRIDANGAFNYDQAVPILKQLARLGAHSIEQPIGSDRPAELKRLIDLRLLPIALDESLIGVNTDEEKKAIVLNLKPDYLVLKPTLVGGLQDAVKWIALAEKHKIGWWLTSSLETNTGLNAIAQLAGKYATSLPQGLSTGKIFRNNFPSPLSLNRNMLSFSNQDVTEPQRLWNFLNSNKAHF